MRVDRRFAPFRADATCTIKPQGLIAENYVDCDPGHAGRPSRCARRGGDAPTVPVEQTTQPVSLTDLFEVWNTPTRQRLGVLLSTLGIATRRSRRGPQRDPAPRQPGARARPPDDRRSCARQRDDLAAVDRRRGTGRRASWRGGPSELRRLLRHGARVDHARPRPQRGGAGRGRCAGCPACCARARPALAEARRGHGRRRAAARPARRRGARRQPPDRRHPPAGRGGAPDAAALGPCCGAGAATARRTAPLSAAAAHATRATSLPSARTAARCFPTLEERGFDADLLSVPLQHRRWPRARYDEQGHLLPAHVGLTSCTRYATTPDPACGAARGPPAPRAAPRRRCEHRDAAASAPPRARARASRPTREPAAAGPAPEPRSAPPTCPGSPARAPTRPPTDAVEGLLDFLLG